MFLPCLPQENKLRKQTTLEFELCYVNSTANDFFRGKPEFTLISAVPLPGESICSFVGIARSKAK